jgi:dolichol-phosphate mannosyltransferase
LKHIQYENIVSNGYSFLGELLFRAKEVKTEIREMPFIFHERIYGTSKLGKSEIKGFLLYAFRSIMYRTARFFHAMP